MNMLQEHVTFFRNLLLIVLGLLFFAWITNPLTVTVTGVGSVDVPATSAIISLTTTDINDSPTLAQANLEQKLQLLKQTLLENGVDSQKLIESQIQIIPASSLVPGATGFAATTTLGGPTSQITNLGTLTALLYERGATLVSQPVLQNEDLDKLESQALKDALKNAQDQAGSIGSKNFRFFRRIGAVTQVDTPTTGTFTSQQEVTEGEEAAPPNTFKIAKAIQVTYLMW